MCAFFGIGEKNVLKSQLLYFRPQKRCSFSRYQCKICVEFLNTPPPPKKRKIKTVPLLDFKGTTGHTLRLKLSKATCRCFQLNVYFFKEAKWNKR